VLYCVHPVDGQGLEFQSPLPADFTAALAGLRADLGRAASGPEQG
jgi:hypothetical protein